jgi:hypothetical protein
MDLWEGVVFAEEDEGSGSCGVEPMGGSVRVICGVDVMRRNV